MRSARSGLPLVVAFGLVACLLYGVGGGLRADIGILLQPLATHTGLAYADVSQCVAVMQLVFGVAQPTFGVVASRRSNRFVLELGVALLAAGLVGTALASSFVALLVSLGVLFGLGVGALSFGTILASAINFVGQKNAMTISGMLNAAAGMGSFILSPVLQTLVQAGGVSGALLVMLAPVAVLAPAALVVTSRDPRLDTHAPAASAGTDVDAAAGPGARAVAGRPALPFREAFRNRTFLLLVAGFSTCGFHMVIIESHLFNQFVLEGIDAASASWAFSIYGIATIVGALASGWLSGRAPKGRLLAFYYGFRALWVAAYVLLMPKTLPFALLFGIGLGLTGDATVSPTSGLVSDTFSVEQVATLVGTLFLFHQVGAYLSAWLGGVLLAATGGYATLWAIDVVLCLAASLASARIAE